MKPVAWIREDGVVAFHEKKEVDSQGFKWFPLYTHPAKELTMTDDEVMDLWNEQSSHPIDFARAILRKAQNG